MVDSLSDRHSLLGGVSFLSLGARNMFGRNSVSDKDLLKAVNQRLTRSGSGSQSRIVAMVNQGSVTLTGNLQIAYQRDLIVKTVARIAGVRRVVDLLKLTPKKRPEKDHGMKAANHQLPDAAQPDSAEIGIEGGETSLEEPVDGADVEAGKVEDEPGDQAGD
jgi:hypothetical protein